MDAAEVGVASAPDSFDGSRHQVEAMVESRGEELTDGTATAEASLVVSSDSEVSALGEAPPPPSSSYFCYICYELMPYNASHAHILDACGHIYCRDCLRSMLRVNVKEAKVFMKCFVPSSSSAEENPSGAAAEADRRGKQKFCDVLLTDNDVRFILLGVGSGSSDSSDSNTVVAGESIGADNNDSNVYGSSDISDEKLFLKFQQFKFLRENKLGRLCPYCENMQLYCPPCVDEEDGEDEEDEEDEEEGGGGETVDSSAIALSIGIGRGGRAREMLCQSCSMVFCERHGSAHRNGSCEAYELSIALETRACEGLIRENSKACPACGVFISKTGGCNHMKCPVCEQSFCWLCGEAIEDGVFPAHFQWWNVGKCSNLQMNEEIVPSTRTRMIAKLTALVEIVIIGPVAVLSAGLSFLACCCCILPVARAMPPSRLSGDNSLRARVGRLFTECVGLWGLFWVFLVFMFPYALLLLVLLLAVFLLVLPLIVLSSASQGRCLSASPSNGLAMSALQNIISEEVVGVGAMAGVVNIAALTPRAAAADKETRARDNTDNV